MGEKSKTNPAFQKQLIETISQVNDYKMVCESNIVASIYKQSDLLLNTNLELDEISNNAWRVYFVIAQQLITIENKPKLDDMTVGLYLEKHDKLRERYYEYGGYDTLDRAMAEVKVENFDGYVSDLRKWNSIIKLARRGFAVSDDISRYCDMTSEQIYDEFEAYLNSVYVNIDRDVKTYDIADGIDKLIDELDAGFALGLPYYDMPMLTDETGGQYVGSITLIMGLSNVGKSTFARNACIPSALQKGKKIVAMINEDNLVKWQRELLIYVANNIKKRDLQKNVVRNGKYSEETRGILVEAAEWIKEHTKNHMITVVPFLQYKTKNVIKTIKKFCSLGVEYFILDTFKLDAGDSTEQSWLQMQQHMVEINDVIKPEAKNVHILITAQLSKGSVHQRYFTQDSTGLAKNIIDVASTCIMIRDVYEDEYKGEKRELKVYRKEGKNGKTMIPVELDRTKHYQVLFITKNREGSANQHQIVIEHDMSRNMMKEIGICNVMPDF